MIGNLVAQTIILLATPIITRLYSPAEFGIAAVVTSATVIAGSVACGGYHSAVALPESNRRASEVMVAAIFVLCVMSPLLGLIFIISPWSDMLHDGGIAKSVGFIAVALGAALVGTHSLQRHWGIRHQHYNSIAIGRILLSFVKILAQLMFFLGGAIGLIAGNLVAAIACNVYLKKQHTKLEPVTLAGVSTTAVRYKRFPLFSTWSALLNTTGRQLPVFLFVALFGVSSAGMYSLAERVVAAPVSMVSTAVASVFLRASATAKENNSLARLVISTHGELTKIALAPFLLLAVAAPVLFEIIFGHQWTNSGFVASWLCLYLYFSFVVAPLTMLFKTLEKQDLELKIQVIAFVARFIAIVVSAKIGNFFVAVAAYSIVGVLYYAFIMWWCCRMVHLNFSKLYLQTITSFFWALVTVFPCFYLTHIDINERILTGISCSSALILIVYVFRRT